MEVIHGLDNQRSKYASLLSSANMAAIRMDPEVRILIYERTYNSYGVGFVVKDGHADVQIGQQRRRPVGLRSMAPPETLSFFPVPVDSIQTSAAISSSSALLRVEKGSMSSSM